MRIIFFTSLTAFLIFATTNWYLNTAHLCPAPILYRIGEVDERFSISTTTLAEIAAAAEATWEKELNRELFVYDDTAEFSINLIYDERQRLASTEEEWRQSLDAEQADYEALVKELESLGARYQSAQASYTTVREAYEARLAAYNAEVERYNNEGGAPPQVFAELEAEARQINTDLKQVLAAEKTINELATTINELGETGNKKIAAYNEAVLEYNELFGELGTFTQGDYERERINIYKFSDTTELSRVIVHEFGHALGIGHVEGETSVMYYLMTDRDVSQLSLTDTAALLDVCGSDATWQQKVRQFIRTLLHNLN